MKENAKGNAPAKIVLSEETADFLVLYRDTNVLFNRIYETVKKYAPDPENEKGVDELYTPFAEPARATLAALLDIVNNNIEWGLTNPDDVTV